MGDLWDCADHKVRIYGYLWPWQLGVAGPDTADYTAIDGEIIQHSY